MLFERLGIVGCRAVLNRVVAEVDIGGLVGIERGLDRLDTGVADRAGGQSLEGVGVIARDEGRTDALGHVRILAVGIIDGTVAVELGNAVGAAVLETVVQDRGDIVHILLVRCLGLDDRGDREDLVEGITGLRGLLLEGGFLGVTEVLLLMRDNLGLVVVEEFFDRDLGILADIEVIGIREEVALEAIVALVVIRDILQEGVVLVKGGGVAHVEEGLDIRGNALLIQQGRDFEHIHTFGDLDCHDIGTVRVALQGVDDRLIVLVGVELELTLAEVVDRRGDLSVHLEEPRLADNAVVLEDIGDLVEGGVLRNADRDGADVLGTRDTEHIVHTYEDELGEDDGDDDDHRQPYPLEDRAVALGLELLDALFFLALLLERFLGVTLDAAAGVGVGEGVNLFALVLAARLLFLFGRLKLSRGGERIVSADRAAVKAAGELLALLAASLLDALGGFGGQVFGCKISHNHAPFTGHN